MFNQVSKKWLLYSLLSSLISVCCVYVLSQSDAWQQLENTAFDAQSNIIPAKVSKTDIVIVAIDEQSFAHYQSSWPWPAGYYTNLLKRLNQAGAQAVVLNLPIDALPNANEEEASNFASSITASNLPVYLAKSKSRQDDSLLNYYRDAGVKIKSFELSSDLDGVIRHLPHSSSISYAFSVQDPTNNNRIHFIGDTNSFVTIPFFKAASSNLLPDHIFKDKIVLVGIDILANTRFGDTAIDRYRTPFTWLSGNTMSGVEVHANAIVNVQNGSSISTLTVLQTPFLALLVALFASYLFTAASLKKSLLGLAKLLGFITIISLFAFYHGVSLPVVSLCAIAISSYLFYFVLGFRKQQRQQQFITNAFSRYVSNQVLHELKDNPTKLELGGERKFLAILFADLAGFTKLAEQTQAEQVADILHQVLTAHSRIIVKHGGTLDKYLGDAVMAFWGAPVACKNSVEKAVAAAIEMNATCVKISKEFQRQGLPELKLRIGVNYGEVIVGHLGSDILFDYTCIGDAVNQAARLESANRLYGSDLLIGQAVYEQLSDKSHFTLIDKVVLKGKSQAINIYCYFETPKHQQALKQAFSAYCDRDWQKAHSYYQSLYSESELMVLCRLFLERIEEYKRQALPSTWGGESYLDNK
ncbi:adenylate/guanylate cyclase domain-containing protein [Pseudoalteromonas spongiae]|uniref:Adenylate/guanylate cyclase domain-containing protein n=1 Tax=Pseudoalteromonas spongiae TaxID=298657 RepID=A0ABU8ERJ5_9GAMM